MHTNL
jgi:hypothetical protein